MPACRIIDELKQGEMKMKRLIIGCIAFLLALSVSATEPQQKFSPEKFQAELEQFITEQACLTPQEATKFFPLYREMQKKQRAIFNQMRTEGKIKPADEAACKKAIQRRDELELELKSIAQTYHNKFFCVLPASKVFDVIMAEDRFHRRALKNWGNNRAPHNNQAPRKK